MFFEVSGYWEVEPCCCGKVDQDCVMLPEPLVLLISRDKGGSQTAEIKIEKLAFGFSS